MEPGELIRPPEAPVFQPTIEEFKDPIAYISKIRPVVVNTGICKIKPPSGWRPPFAVNIDKFRFTPRLQPLNELEAKTRVKLNFLDNLTKFWEMQGITFKVPNVNRTPLDLHTLYKVVIGLGGFDEVCRTRKWVFIAREMRYDNHTVAGSLRINYEKYLFPYEIFQMKNGQLKLQSKSSLSRIHHSLTHQYTSVKEEQEVDLEEDIEELDMEDEDDSRGKMTRMSDGTLRRSKRKRLEDPDYDFSLAEDNPEFKKLAFSAPGPKNAYAPVKRTSRRCSQKLHALTRAIEDDISDIVDIGFMNMPSVKRDGGKRACEECGGDYCEEELLSCGGCTTCYHTFCLIPQLPSLPCGAWYCPRCVAKECCNPQEAFGFEQGKKLYSLQSFGQMANQFKTDYFHQQPTEVPYATVEKEFWRLVTSIDDEVTVEYGADLHSSKHGSGFPTRDPSTGHLTIPGAEEYASSGWNLNNLPVLKGSVLSYIDVDISGMKVPWLYVGMCFSCFCWHTEDHWSYSINYLHWGEAKTWYGVPSAYADALEATMKEQAPELFENQPDLMHHLATTLNPSLLLKNGIPVVRTDQCAGEFVVTFPRAYHAGFNQGFNFAEAVNFALADWLPFGRDSIDHYRITQKSPVFSHDELICKMAAAPEELDLSVLIMAAKDASNMLAIEERLRYSLKNAGLLFEVKEIFELVSDDDRQCSVCKTCCFLLGVRCSCNSKLLSCPHHFQDMCSCPVVNKTLRYRYSLDELRQLMSSSQQRANLYCTWANRVDQLLDGFNKPKPDLPYMKNLLSEGESKGFTNCEQYHELAATIVEAERILVAVQDILQPKTRDQLVSVAELHQFLQDVSSLPCVLPEADALKVHLHTVTEFQQEVTSVLSSLTSSYSSTSQNITLLQEFIRQGEKLSIDIPQLEDLRNAINQLEWIQDSETLLSREESLHVDHLKSMYKKGQTLPHNKAVETVLVRLKTLLGSVQDWEHKIKMALKEKPPHPISYYETMLAEVNELSVTIPLVQTLAQTVKQAKEWNAKAQQLQAIDSPPHYDTLKELLSSARPLSVRLDQLPQVESRYSAAKAWVDRTSRTFLKKNTSCSLLEVLLPRTPATSSTINGKTNKKKHEDEYSVQTTPLSVADGDRIKEMEIIREMEKDEKDYIDKCRKANLDKQRCDELSSSNSSPVLYCLCKKPESGYMLQCEVCNEWYHANCLHIPKSKLNQDTDVSKDMRFICGACLRSRRPRLDIMVSLLISLQKVPVAISEGTALHCLAERVMTWQKQARTLIASTSGIIDAARGQQLRLSDIRKKINKWKQEASSEALRNDIHAQLANQADSVLKHYEAQLSKEKATYAGLNETQRKRAEETLLEGDLLEVTTDETTQLWQLLQTDSECIAYFTLSEEEAMNYNLPKLSQIKKPSVIIEENEDDSTSLPAKKRKKGEGTDTKGNLDTTTAEFTPPTNVKRKKGMVKQEKKGKSSPSKANRSRQSPSVDILGCSEQFPPEEEDSEDSVDACSAPQCIRPMANQISWVQCDLCQHWFHLLCVGLTTASVEKMDIYNCSVCKHKNITEKKSLINSSTTDKKSVYVSILPNQTSLL